MGFMHEQLFAELGLLNRSEVMFGTENERVLKRVGDRQIAQLYGVSMRSVPTFMVTDDHDLFDNDESTDELTTLPPDDLMQRAAQAIQQMYYPEFLPDPTRPPDLPGAFEVPGAGCYSRVFGTARFGRLFEGLLYDTKRFATIDGHTASMVPPAVEAWLEARNASTDTIHLAHVPSTPMGWTAGKWGEWYPDVFADSAVGAAMPKYRWPKTWWDQHQRLLASMAKRQGQMPFVFSGDLHMFSAGRIERSGDLNLTANPICAFVVGPIGTGQPVFPSAARGILPQIPKAMRVEELFPPLERNGFTIIDIEEQTVTVRFFAWAASESAEQIDNMPPIFEFTLN